MSSILINLLNWRPGYSGFASYVLRSLPRLRGTCLFYDSQAKAIRSADLAQWTDAQLCEPQSLSSPGGTLDSLHHYCLVQFASRQRHALLTSGVDCSSLTGVYSPYSHYISAFSNLPQILTCHDLTPLVFPSSRKAWFYYRLWIPSQLHRARRIIAISHFVATQLVEIGIPANRIHVIPNGIAPEKSPLTVPLSADLLIVARHQRNKNIRLALRAIYRLQVEYPKKWDGVLRIVGRKGRESPAVQQMLRELPCPHQVQLIDQLSSADLAQVRRNSLALISTSLMEGCNYPVLEACAVGLPSLVSRIPVHQEFYANCSLLFSVSDDGVELCHQILRLLQEPQLWSQLNYQALLTAQHFSLINQQSQLQDQIAQLIP